MARLKASADLVKAIEPAVRFYEEPPAKRMTVETPWSDIALSPGDWAEAFDAAEPGTPHNEAREQIWGALLTILIDKHDGGAPDFLLRKSLEQNKELRATVNRAWPLIEATELVADLWSVPAYLRKCAPWLSRDDVQALQHENAQSWTVSDLPLLDAARHRLGDPEAADLSRRRDAAVAARQASMADVVDDLIESDDSEMLVMSMLRGQDLQVVLVDEAALPTVDRYPLAGSFAHVVVDEAQELTDAEWQMLLLAARPGVSPSWGTVPRPGAGSRSPGRNGSSGSGSTASAWPT